MRGKECGKPARKDDGQACEASADAVNVICDDRIIPAMKYRVPAKTSGFTVGQLILDADSGAYAAGLTADDTSRRYQVRVLRFRFTWTRP